MMGGVATHLAPDRAPVPARPWIGSKTGASPPRFAAYARTSVDSRARLRAAFFDAFVRK
jgi:hypothetical protein